MKSQFERLKRIRDLAVSMLADAQVIRIQQAQATSDWDERYKANADNAWRRLNNASETIEAELGKLMAESQVT